MSIRSTAAILLTTAIAFTSFAGEPAQVAAMDADVSKFFEKAASAGKLEVEAGRLAGTKASNPQLKEFGQRMASEHAQASAELRALAARKGMTLPATMADDQRKEIEKLRAENPGKDFDTRFRDLMIESHEDAVSLFEDAAKDSKDPDVKAFAARMLPKLQQHETAAKALPKV